MTLRQFLYRAARLVGDVEAASRGPGAYGKRLVRKAIWKQVGRGTQRATRRIGL